MTPPSRSREATTCRRLRPALSWIAAAFFLPVSLVACGSGHGDQAGGCSGLVGDAIELQLDYSRDVRGIAGADEAAYRVRAESLVTEARRLDCPVPPGVRDFLR
jgi:hypothetical protein